LGVLARGGLRVRLLEVGEQVFGVLDAGREAEQVGGNWGRRAFDRGAVFDQAFDAASSRGAGPAKVVRYMSRRCPR
jgi:hypothetical protein